MRGVVDAGFELFDHTADVGIRVWAATMPELVRPAGAGLYTAIGELAPGDAADSGSWECASEVLSGADNSVRITKGLTANSYNSRQMTKEQVKEVKRLGKNWEDSKQATQDFISDLGSVLSRGRRLR